ncbi:MAG: 4Fe-4S binding protein [Dysgonamonadaceae bacterium]|nr:4Fe-4S binding protein [Dysgonamonadaceae bacterium]
MKKFSQILTAIVCPVMSMAQNRFPKPDFESGYTYPDLAYYIPKEAWWNIVDVTLLVAMMTVVAWAVLRRRKRAPVFIVSVISILYFGFYRNGCVCSIGAIQNVALALTDSAYSMPLAVFLFFILPIIFTLFFGRVFCAGVCPFGALQELMNLRNIRIPKPLSAALGIIPWIYLIFAVLYAVTRSRFVVCRFDPFIGIFRMSGDFGIVSFGALLLVVSVFFGRPFCRFICPYGALLSLFSRVSLKQTTITAQCINCDLCRNACPVDAIHPPYNNKVKESRTSGVRRLLAYFLFLPVTGLVFALLMRASSDILSSVHKDVKLYELVKQNELHPQDILPVDIEVFLSQGGTVEELAERTAQIRSEFKTYSTVAGALTGLLTGITLITLSLKRARKTYEIDAAACVSCGRCFDYCPQNRNIIINKKT